MHAIHREHEAAARRVLARHDSVVEESIRFDGERLRWDLDLGRLPDGDGPSVEGVIKGEIDREPRP